MVTLEPKQQLSKLTLRISGQFKVFLLNIAFTQSKIFGWPTSSVFPHLFFSVELWSLADERIWQKYMLLPRSLQLQKFLICLPPCQSKECAEKDALIRLLNNRAQRQWNRKPEAIFRSQEIWSCYLYLQLLKITKLQRNGEQWNCSWFHFLTWWRMSREQVSMEKVINHKV